MIRAFVYVIIFFSFFDLFTQLPIMSPYAESLGATPFLTGLAVGMYSFSNTIGNVVSGFWTDRRGPFFILVVGLLTTGVSLALYQVVADPWSLLAIRFVHGLLAGLIVPAAFTYLANETEKEKRGKGVAISGSFVGMAAIIGPAFSGIMASRTSEPFVLGITAICMIILGVLSIFFLRSVGVQSRTTSNHNKITVRMFFTDEGIIKAFTGAFFLMFSQGVLAYMLPLKVIRLCLDSKSTGMLLSTFGIVAILVFLLPINRIFDKVLPIKTLSIGMALMGLSLLFISQSGDISLLYGWMGLYGVGFALLFPSINSLLIDSTDPTNRGKAYGYFYAFFSFGVVIGSGLTGLLALSPDGGFILTGSLLAVASAIIYFTKK